MGIGVVPPLDFYHDFGRESKLSLDWMDLGSSSKHIQLFNLCSQTLGG